MEDELDEENHNTETKSSKGQLQPMQEMMRGYGRAVVTGMGEGGFKSLEG